MRNACRSGWDLQFTEDPSPPDSAGPFDAAGRRYGLCLFRRRSVAGPATIVARTYQTFWLDCADRRPSPREAVQRCQLTVMFCTLVGRLIGPSPGGHTLPLSPNTRVSIATI